MPIPFFSRLLILSCALFIPFLGFAQKTPPVNQLPTGGVVGSGSASISQVTGSAGSSMVINQSSTKSSINWNTFDLGSGSSVTFNQPSSSSVTLNRVGDTNPSQIFGKISANGQIYLINPLGIYFSPSASIDVADIIASTSNISDGDFIANNIFFKQNDSNGFINNAGTIKASKGGFIGLFAPNIQNDGLIIARSGTIALATGDAITLKFDANQGFAGIQTTPAKVATLIQNNQAIIAPNGRIILSAVGLSTLQAGTINNNGLIKANSLKNTGGVISLEADEITLGTSSQTQATGASGGGSIFIGGGPQGSGNLRQSTAVDVLTGAIIDASATQNGAGGQIVVYSNTQNPSSLTTISGQLSTLGGQYGGNGGSIETSGHNLKITDTAQISTYGLKGATGNWLLDPYDFTIASTGGDISASALSTLLATNNIAIYTSTGVNSATSLYSTMTGSGNININDNIAWTSAHSLTFNASNLIQGSGNISIGSNSSVYFNPSSGSAITGYAGIVSGAGHLYVEGATQTFTANNTLAGAISVLAGATLQYGNGGTTGSFNTVASITNNGTLSFDRSNSLSVTQNIAGNGGLYNIGAGTTTVSGTSTFTGGVNISAGEINATSASALGGSTGGTVTIGASGKLNVSSSSTVNIQNLIMSPGSFITSINSGAGGLNVVGTSSLAGTAAAITLQFSGPVTIVGSTELYSSANAGTVGVKFLSTIDSAPGNPYALAISNPYGASLSFAGAIGSAHPLLSLGTDKQTSFSANVSTINAQNYSGPVTLTGNTVLSTQNSNITFGSTVDSTTTAYSLSTSTGTGSTVFGDAVGSTHPLLSLTTSGASTITGNITTTGLQNYGGAASLSTSSIIQGSTVSLNGLANSGGNDLSIISNGLSLLGAMVGNGGTFSYSQLNLANTLGLGSSAIGTTVLNDTTLAYIANSGFSSTVLGSLSGTGAIDYAPSSSPGTFNGSLIIQNGAAGIKLHANLVSTGDLLLSGPITLASTVSLTSNTGSINVSSTIDDSSPGTHSLTTSAQNDTTFAQSIGSTVPIGNLTVTTNTLSTQDIALNSSSSLSLNISSDGAINGAFTGSGGASLTKSGAGTLTLNSSSNSYSGGTSINNGTVTVATDSALGSIPGVPTTNISLNGGALVINPSTPFTLNQNRQISIGPNGGEIDNASSSFGFTYAGQINGGLNTLTLGSPSNPGAITISGAINIGNLLVNSVSATVLNNANNNIGTLAGTNLGDITVLNGSSLSVGTVGSISGLSSSGLIDIETSANNNITVYQDITTSSSSNTAIILSAGNTVQAGSASGGNVLISGTPSINTGAGGIGVIYTGSVASSTGVTSLVGSGSGQFRYDSNQGTTNYSSPLLAGLNAIYREQPTLTASVVSQTVMVGSPIPSFTSTFTGAVNGDTPLQNLIAYSTTATSQSVSGTYPVYGTAGTIDTLGYGISTITPGTLTLTKVGDTSTTAGQMEHLIDNTLNLFPNGINLVFGNLSNYVDKTLSSKTLRPLPIKTSGSPILLPSEAQEVLNHQDF